MTILTVTNQKGGVGKTALTFHLAYLFARDGVRTLLLDLDPQGNLSRSYLEDTPPEAHIRLLFENQMPEPYPVAPNLYLVGSDITLSKYEADAKLENFFRVRTFLQEMNPAYDIVLIDTPPSLGLFTSNALLASERVLIPVDISHYARIGLADLMESIEKVRETTGSRLSVLGIVFSAVRERLRFFQAFRRDLEQRYPGLPFRTFIPESVRVREAISRRQTVFEAFPRHKVTRAFEALYQEIKERLP